MKKLQNKMNYDLIFIMDSVIVNDDKTDDVKTDNIVYWF